MNKSNITVNTGLSGFRLLDSLDLVEENKISGSIFFDSADFYLAIESMAQISAYHNRYKNDFQRHSFLLKVKNCSYQVNKCLSGNYFITAQETAFTEKAATYSASISDGDKFNITAEIIIASDDYSDKFPRKKFEKYYRDVFQCLIKTGKKN